MSVRNTLVVAGFVYACCTASAFAADIYAPSTGGLKDQMPSEQIFIPEAIGYQESADWYIRGDVGLGFISDDGNVTTSDAYSTETGDLKFRPVKSFGVGFGRYVTPNVRLGLDLDYRDANDSDVNFASGTMPTQVKMSSTSLMFNAVYDFAPERWISPYVGGGIGWAFHTMTLENQTFIYDVDGDTANETVTFSDDAKDSNDFAANVIAGVSFKIRRNLFVDVGYKFSYLGDAKTTTNVNIDGTDYKEQMTVDDMMAHELKVGLRYDLY